MSKSKDTGGLGFGRCMPPFAALFQGDMVPSQSALQLLISDIDDQLDLNTKELDNCLQSILTSANNLPGSRTFSTPRDALGYVCSSHTLEKDTCYDPEPEEAVAIISALCDSLEKNPGSEESILQEILGLASEEGLILPLRTSSSVAATQSSSSLNVQLDSMDHLIEGKWAKLTQVLQKHLVSELLKLPPLAKNRKASWVVIERRLELVGGLRALASDDEAWVTYRNVRGQQLEQLFNSLLPDNDSENVNYKEFCCNCGIVADRIIDMIEEDFTVLCTGVFKKIGGVYRVLHDLYLEKYSDEMSLLVEEIADDIRDFNKKVVKASKSDHGLAKSDGNSAGKSHGKLAQRGSVGGPVASPESWASKTPNNSQSLDTMFLASSYKTEKQGTPRLQKQFSMTFPKDCIISLRHIALSLMKLEDFLEGLTKMTSWDITGLPHKKAKKKSSLRGVLKPSASPELKRHSLNLGSSFSSSDTPFEAVHPKAQEDPAPAPKVVERSKSEEKVRWDWRLIFKKIASGLASAVETKIDHTMSTTLSQEVSRWESKHNFDTLNLELTQFGEGMDHPHVVSKDTHDFLEAVDLLLPLARAGMEGCLIPVRSAFIDSLGIAVKNFHLHCVSLSKDIPHKAPLKNMLIIISNAAYIKNYLQHVETMLSPEESGKKVMSSLLKQYTDLIDGLGKHLLLLHSQMISTSVFSDADSGNWSINKEFQEDERCSFTIQMWNYYLQGIQHDMWQILPPKLAQSYFSSILQDSLLLLMQRYARVKPSFRRVKQMRYDVTAILLCCTEHLLKACTSVSQYLDPGHNQLPHYSIHNQCSNLLATMAVVTSPLENLYRVYKRGYDRRLEVSESSEQRLCGNNTDWLHWIWPGLIHSGTKHYDDMQTASALYLHLRMFYSQPQIDWGGLAQALFMKDYTLAILLLTKICQQDDNQDSSNLREKSSPVAEANANSNNISGLSKLVAQHSTQSSTDSNSPMDVGPSLLRPSVPLVATPETDVQRVVKAMVRVLGQVHYFPKALAKCIVPVIDRACGWELFDVKNPSVTPEQKRPEWLNAIFEMLEPFIGRVVEPMLRYLMTVKSTENYIRPVISYVADLPCGCPPNYSLRDHAPPPTVKDVLTTCLELIILEIEKSVLLLPASMCVLFASIDSNCKEQGVKTSHRCVALHVIAWAIWEWLGYFSSSAEGLGDMIKPDVKTQVLTVADTLFHILVYGKGPNTPRFAAKFIKSHKDWLSDRIHNISTYISEDYHSMPTADVTEAATNIFSDHIFSLIAFNILDSPTGYNDLRVIANLVVNNSQWILDQMDISTPLSSPSSDIADTKTSTFSLDLSDPPKKGRFNPISAMVSIGENSFNHVAIQEFAYDWPALLSSDLGLSQPAFRSLLMNRHEMQEGAHLEEAEKKPVDVLKAVYEH